MSLYPSTLALLEYIYIYIYVFEAKRIIVIFLRRLAVDC